MFRKPVAIIIFSALLVIVLATVVYQELSKSSHASIYSSKKLYFPSGTGLSNLTLYLNLPQPTLVNNPIWVEGPFFYIDSSCQDQADNIKYSIRLWELESSNLVDFVQAENRSYANLLFNCVDYYIDPVYEGGFLEHATLGETQISHDYNLNNFTIIQRVEVLLGRSSLNCTRPVRIMHEIGHALGLAHTETDKSSILYPIVDCNQRFTPEIVNTIKELYTRGAVPNVQITQPVSAWSNGYLNVTTTVSNVGGRNSGDFQIYIEDQDKLLNTTQVSSLFIGESRKLEIYNIPLIQPPSEVQLFVHGILNSPGTASGNAVLIPDSP